jgi:hypothetical protein
MVFKRTCFDLRRSSSGVFLTCTVLRWWECICLVGVYCSVLPVQVSIIHNNKCTQLYYSYNNYNMIKKQTPTWFRTLLAHHQAVNVGISNFCNIILNLIQQCAFWWFQLQEMNCNARNGKISVLRSVIFISFV